MCMKNWNLGKELTKDEMMVRYKSKYLPIQQHLPNKPVKWGFEGK